MQRLIILEAEIVEIRNRPGVPEQQNTTPD
jgi:hypothetical protein